MSNTRSGEVSVCAAIAGKGNLLNVSAFPCASVSSETSTCTYTAVETTSTYEQIPVVSVLVLHSIMLAVVYGQ